jgi:hypothetical protein
MSTTIHSATTANIESARHPDATTTRFWRVGLASGAVASVATVATVLIARAADVAVAIDGEKVPVDGFVLFTMVGALIGVAIARTMSRRARHPRAMFVSTTVALTVLSIVPDVLIEADAASKVVLALTHLIAAAIIVPALASRLAR